MLVCSLKVQREYLIYIFVPINSLATKNQIDKMKASVEDYFDVLRRNQILNGKKNIDIKNMFCLDMSIRN